MVQRLWQGTAVMVLGPRAAAHLVLLLRLLHSRGRMYAYDVSPLVQDNVRFWWSLKHPLVGTPLGRVTSYVTVFIDVTLLTLTEEWYMVAIGDATHQSPQASSCVPCSPTLNAPLIRARRDGENQQLHCD